MDVDRFYSRLSRSTPPWVLRAFGRINIPLYRLSGGRLGGSIGAAPVLLLHTVGRRSGEPRVAPLVYGVDGEQMVVIGSNAGHERTPAWALNLLAQPEAEIEIRGQRRPVRARVVEGDERERLWRSMNEQYSGFDDYRRRTGRAIPVFVLEGR